MITPLMTRAGAAAILGISTKTLDRMIARLEIAASKYGGCVRFTQKSVSDYIESQTIAPITASPSRGTTKPVAVPHAATGTA